MKVFIPLAIVATLVTILLLALGFRPGDTVFWTFLVLAAVAGVISALYGRR